MTRSSYNLRLQAQYKKMEKARDKWAGFCRQLQANQFLGDIDQFQVNIHAAHVAYRTELNILRKMTIEQGIMPTITIKRIET